MLPREIRALRRDESKEDKARSSEKHGAHRRIKVNFGMAKQFFSRKKAVCLSM